MKKIFTSIIALLCASVVLLKAQPAGTLDVTFNGTGSALFNPSLTSHDNANAMVVQPDSMIVVAGVSQTSPTTTKFDIIVGRLFPNGTIDASFGTNGWFVYDHAGHSDFGYDVDLQPDGKIIVTGAVSYAAANTGFSVIRLNPNGTLDTSFNGTGKVFIDVNTGEDYAQEGIVQPDGKIVLAGYSKTPGFTYNNAALVRLNANGTLDSTFGTGGISLPQFSMQSERIDGMIMTPDSNYIAVGYTTQSTNQNAIAMGFKYDGSIDSTFGTNGTKTITGNSYANAIKRQNNKYLIAGWGSSGTPNGCVTALDESGNYVASFGSGGQRYLNLSSAISLSDLTIQADSKAVVCGRNFTSPGSGDFYIARLDTSGNLDAGFATSGYLILNIVTQLSENALGVAIQPDNKILVCGVGIPSANNDMIVVRLHAGTVVSGVTHAVGDNELFSVYPNPAIDKVNILLNKNKVAGVQLNIYNTTGQLVISRALTESTTTIDIGAISKGVYLFELISDSEKSRVKVLVE